MTEQTENISMHDSFIKKNEEQSDKILEEAQRLVNLYRHSNSFSSDFRKDLDEKLLYASAEVQSALSRIIGGEEVRRYLDFLKSNTMSPSSSTTDINEDGDQIPMAGYLPDPENDISVCNSSNTSENIQINYLPALEKVIKEFNSAHQSELGELLKAQTDTLTQLLKQMDQKRQELAGHQTDRLINALNQDINKRDKYSDIIETSPTTPSFDETKGF